MLYVHSFSMSSNQEGTEKSRTITTSKMCYVPQCNNSGYKIKTQWNNKKCPEHNVWFGDPGCDCLLPFRWVMALLEKS